MAEKPAAGQSGNQGNYRSTAFNNLVSSTYGGSQEPRTTAFENKEEMLGCFFGESLLPARKPLSRSDYPAFRLRDVVGAIRHEDERRDVVQSVQTIGKPATYEGSGHPEKPAQGTVVYQGDVGPDILKLANGMEFLLGEYRNFLNSRGQSAEEVQAAVSEVSSQLTLFRAELIQRDERQKREVDGVRFNERQDAEAYIKKYREFAEEVAVILRKSLSAEANRLQRLEVGFYSAVERTRNEIRSDVSRQVLTDVFRGVLRDEIAIGTVDMQAMADMSGIPDLLRIAKRLEGSTTGLAEFGKLAQGQVAAITLLAQRVQGQQPSIEEVKKDVKDIVAFRNEMLAKINSIYDVATRVLSIDYGIDADEAREIIRQELGKITLTVDYDKIRSEYRSALGDLRVLKGSLERLEGGNRKVLNGLDLTLKSLIGIRNQLPQEYRSRFDTAYRTLEVLDKRSKEIETAIRNGKLSSDSLASVVTAAVKEILLTVGKIGSVDQAGLVRSMTLAIDAAFNRLKLPAPVIQDVNIDGSSIRDTIADALRVVKAEGANQTALVQSVTAEVQRFLDSRPQTPATQPIDQSRLQQALVNAVSEYISRLTITRVDADSIGPVLVAALTQVRGDALVRLTREEIIDTVTRTISSQLASRESPEATASIAEQLETFRRSLENQYTTDEVADAVFEKLKAEGVGSLKIEDTVKAAVKEAVKGVKIEPKVTIDAAALKKVREADALDVVRGLGVYFRSDEGKELLGEVIGTGSKVEIDYGKLSDMVADKIAAKKPVRDRPAVQHRSREPRTEGTDTSEPQSPQTVRVQRRPVVTGTMDDLPRLGEADEKKLLLRYLESHPEHIPSTMGGSFGVPKVRAQIGNPGTRDSLKSHLIGKIGFEEVNRLLGGG